MKKNERRDHFLARALPLSWPTKLNNRLARLYTSSSSLESAHTSPPRALLPPSENDSFHGAYPSPSSSHSAGGVDEKVGCKDTLTLFLRTGVSVDTLDDSIVCAFAFGIGPRTGGGSTGGGGNVNVGGDAMSAREPKAGD